MWIGFDLDGSRVDRAHDDLWEAVAATEGLAIVVRLEVGREALGKIDVDPLEVLVAARYYRAVLSGQHPDLSFAPDDQLDPLLVGYIFDAMLVKRQRRQKLAAQFAYLGSLTIDRGS